MYIGENPLNTLNANQCCILKDSVGLILYQGRREQVRSDTFVYLWALKSWAQELSSGI